MPPAHEEGTTRNALKSERKRPIPAVRQTRRPVCKSHPRTRDQQRERARRMVPESMQWAHLIHPMNGHTGLWHGNCLVARGHHDELGVRASKSRVRLRSQRDFLRAQQHDHVILFGGLPIKVWPHFGRGHHQLTLRSQAPVEKRSWRLTVGQQQRPGRSGRQREAAVPARDASEWSTLAWANHRLSTCSLTQPLWKNPRQYGICI